LCIISKEAFIRELRKVREMGWIPNARPGNNGAVGNTLEDVLGIKENNLPIPNAAEWELKTQRAGTNSLITLLHCEPSPRGARIVPAMLLPKYGWSHKKAGVLYPMTEMSFRQTINALSRTDRGFGLVLDRDMRKVMVSFDANAVAGRHCEWLAGVTREAGVGELCPQPYWGFEDLFHALGAKLHNCFYVKAEAKMKDGKEFFSYGQIYMASSISLDNVIGAIERGRVVVDFDARSGHNHGTKIRMRQGFLHELYAQVVEL
jgi:hypothetical protein